MEIEAPAPTLADRYARVRTLGEGAFGIVYEAVDRATGTRVALKELTRVSPNALAHFKHEFRAVQELDHPNLVRLEALFEDHEKWVIAMELVEGADLLDYLYVEQDGSCFEERKLRETFLQLAQGLEALHAAGFVHRDLKPANILVTPQGRVVLLDFGLAVTVDVRGQSSSAQGIGTVSYMAPEQAAGQLVGPAADWYSFGVCLYQAMTGVLPVDAEGPLAVLAAKQSAQPLPASVQANGIPEDLDALCSALLLVDPQQRPEGSEVRRMLSGATTCRPSLRTSAGARQLQSGVFEGRERELGKLVQAYEAVQARGTQRVVLIEGESGIGKSALVECFIALQPSALALRSRCYENELLAYKAFDGAMDSLAQLLASLPSAECEALLPPGAPLLRRLFPVFASVGPIARAPLTGTAADPSLQRLEGFAAFAALLANLSKRQPLVFAIDDLQWADVESFRMLHAWLDAAPSRCLILATVRPRAELGEDALAGIEALHKRAQVSVLPLSGLPHNSALALARELMGPSVPQARLETVVRESGGHPLFLTVLARYAEGRQSLAPVELTLDAAISARLAALAPEASRLLATVALVGVPMSASMCGRAAELGENELGRRVTELCRQRLLRRRGAGEIACFHDRIRSVAVANMPKELATATHGRVAAALCTHANPDRAQIARHYQAAGELELAHEAYIEAAERALSTLAFARAAMLYARAIEVTSALDVPAERRVFLATLRAHALARAGRSAEAARQYLDAAKSASGEQQISLRIWGVQHLLQSAHFEEGMSAARALLAELGVPLPRGNASAALRLVWERSILRLHSHLSLGTQAGALELRDRMRLDALWALALPITWLEPLASAALSVRHLRLARSLGEPTHMARALAEEAFSRQIRDAPDAVVEDLLARSRLLAGPDAAPSVEVHRAFREGTVAMWRWDLRRAGERLEHAHRLGFESCPDEPWLLTNVRVALGTAWSALGEHARLAASSAAWIAEAHDRDDRFGLSLLSSIGVGYLRHLMADDPEAMSRELEAALRPWPREPFSFAQWGELTALVYSGLYRGGETAQLWLEQNAARLDEAMMLKMQFGRLSLRALRCMAAMAARHGASPERRERLLALARGYAAGIPATFSPYAANTVLSLQAQLAALEGNVEGAQRLVQRGVAVTSQSGDAFVGRTLQYLQGVLTGGAAGTAMRAGALEFFSKQGWKKPRRAVAIMCPAVDDLEAMSTGA